MSPRGDVAFSMIQFTQGESRLPGAIEAAGERQMDCWQTQHDFDSLVSRFKKNTAENADPPEPVMSI